MAVEAVDAHYIKLGRGGAWEAEAIENGVLRFDYREVPHDACLEGRWDEVREILREIRHGNVGTAANDLRQIRAFYETGEDSLFVTFFGGSLRWSRPRGAAVRLDDGSKQRQTVDGWHAVSDAGAPLTTDRLSGRLLQLQMYRGTICRANPFDYLMDKLNDRLPPAANAALAAEAALREAIVAMMRLLTWQDFELLVDLVFSASGWRRVGELGGSQDTLDLDLLLPSTGERAFVQVKSRADAATLADYRARFAQAEAYQRLFFVWHSGPLAEDDVVLEARFGRLAIAVGPRRLAAMVLDAGLATWLRRKVS